MKRVLLQFLSTIFVVSSCVSYSKISEQKMEILNLKTNMIKIEEYVNDLKKDNEELENELKYVNEKLNEDIKSIKTDVEEIKN